jgi:hypothetical protein
MAVRGELGEVGRFVPWDEACRAKQPGFAAGAGEERMSCLAP